MIRDDSYLKNIGKKSSKLVPRIDLHLQSLIELYVSNFDVESTDEQLGHRSRVLWHLFYVVVGLCVSSRTVVNPNRAKRLKIRCQSASLVGSYGVSTGG